MRKSKVKTLIGVIITLVVLLAALAVTAIFIKQELDTNKAAYEAAQKTIITNTKTVYAVVAKTEEGDPTILKAGTTLEENVNVERVSIFSNIDISAYIDEEDLGKPIISDLVDGMPILKSMVAHDDSKEGDREYDVLIANLMKSQAENDLIDIRILFPNGKSYAVATKKRIKNLDIEQNSFTCLLSAEEIHRMDAAAVDAFTISGTKVYTVRYSEGNLSEETIPTYPIRTETLAVMNDDPNVISQASHTVNMQIRDQLEKNLCNLTQEQLDAIVHGWSIDDPAGSKVVLRNSITMDTNNQAVDEITYTWDFDTTDYTTEEE